jgi:recombinational DNA repair protein (RecF pathway)
MRDAALELAMRIIHPGEPSSEMYDLLTSYLDHLETADPARDFPFALWRYCIDLASYLGFSPDLSHCLLCGKVFVPGDTGCLDSAKGGISCTRCGASLAARTALPPTVLEFLRSDSAGTEPLQPLLPEHRMRVTRLLAAYCCHHSDIGAELHAVDFVCEMIGTASS